MTETVEAPSVVRPDGEREVPCYRCGYDVRGLGAEGRCPECGASVDASMRRDAADRAGQPLPIDQSDPRWIRTLAWACALLAGAGLGMVVTSIALVLEWDPPEAVGVVVGLTPFGLLTVGGWLAGAREPLYIGRRRAWLRRLIRAGVVGWVLAMGALLLALLSGDWPGVAYFVGGAIAPAVLSWAFFWRMRDIAFRLHRRGMVIGCTALAFLVPLVCTATLIPGVGEIEYREGHVQILMPYPIFGDGMLPVLLPHALATVRGYDAQTAVHALMMLVFLASLITLTNLCLALRSAAARARTAGVDGHVHDLPEGRVGDGGVGER